MTDVVNLESGNGLIYEITKDNGEKIDIGYLPGVLAFLDGYMSVMEENDREFGVRIIARRKESGK